MILEVRIYKIKPGLCDRFAEFFDAKALPAQEAMGMEGPAWKGGLEEEAFSMIEDYSNVVLVEPTPASAIR
jgi:hypothetical protein